MSPGRFDFFDLSPSDVCFTEKTAGHRLIFFWLIGQNGISLKYCSCLDLGRLLKAVSNATEIRIFLMSPFYGQVLSFFLSIHIFSKQLSRVTGLKWLPACTGWELGYTLNRWPICHRAQERDWKPFTRALRHNLKFPLQSTCAFSGCGRKSSDVRATYKLCRMDLNPGPSSCEAAVPPLSCRVMIAVQLKQHVSVLGDTVNVWMPILWSANVTQTPAPLKNVMRPGFSSPGRTWLEAFQESSGDDSQFSSLLPVLEKKAAISIKPPLWELIFTLLAAALRDEFWCRQENVEKKSFEKSDLLV